MAFHLLHLCLQGVVLQPNARFSTKRKHACDPCTDWNVRWRSSYCWWLTSFTIWEVLSTVNSWKTRRPTYHCDCMHWHWSLMNPWLTRQISRLTEAKCEKWRLPSEFPNWATQLSPWKCPRDPWGWKWPNYLYFINLSIVPNPRLLPILWGRETNDSNWYIHR